MEELNNLNGDIKKSFKSLKWYEWLMMAIMILVALFAMICSFAGKNLITGKADTNPWWLAIINFVSALAGVICIFFTAKASRANFIFAIVNTTTYIVYLVYWHIYATMALEIIVYFPMNIISWIMWYRHKDNQEKHLSKSRKMNWWQNLLVALSIAAVSVLSHFFLIELTGSSWGSIGEKYGTQDLLCWLDAITFAIGIIAIFLEAFRFREQYVWWIITDIVAVVLYSIKVPFDPVYFVKKAIYLIMAVVGLINWIKLNKLRNAENE